MSDRFATEIKCDEYNTFEDIIKNIDGYKKFISIFQWTFAAADDPGFCKEKIEKISPFLSDEQIKSILLLSEMV